MAHTIKGPQVTFLLIDLILVSSKQVISVTGTPLGKEVANEDESATISMIARRLKEGEESVIDSKKKNRDEEEYTSVA